MTEFTTVVIIILKKIINNNMNKFNLIYDTFITKSLQIRIFRALPKNKTIIRKGDYVTKSVKFAVEHAENNCIYEEEPFDVITALVNNTDIKDASNPGEYLATTDIKGEKIYTSKDYDYEGWDSVKNDKNIKKYLI